MMNDDADKGMNTYPLCHDKRVYAGCRCDYCIQRPGSIWNPIRVQTPVREPKEKKMKWEDDPAACLDVTVGDGKYRVYQEHPSKHLKLQRAGVDSNRDLIGDKFIYCLVVEITKLRERVEELSAKS